MVLVALLLVLGIGKLLGSGSGSDPAGTATDAAAKSAAKPSSSAPVLPVGPTAVASTGASSASAAPTGSAVPLVAPSGPCTDDEVTVNPSIPQAWAGGRTTIDLQLQGTQPACTFTVSSSSVVVKITSGNDRIWSTQDCPKAVPSREVVVRSGAVTTVPVRWSGRRSDADCSSSPDWALPGFYHVLAAAYGSTPSDQQFEVTRAPARRVTQTPTPTPEASPSAGAGRSSSTASPSPSSSASPRGRG
ncbi:MAG: hypothetical protein JWR42_2021 [Marmoricola sp.]|nr:hypothetical protein [Marmoricola sp.]